MMETAVRRPSERAGGERRPPPPLVAPAGSPPPRRASRLAEYARRWWFRHLTGALAASVLALAVVIVWQLWTGSRGAWSEFGLGFITSSTWNPVRGEFGALPFVTGTLLTSGMALLIAFPISIGIAILLSEYLPGPLREPLIFIVELLAAIPSVVYGLWGIFILAPLMQAHLIPFIAASPLGWLPIFGEAGPGYTMLTASVILAIMIIPIIASLSREVFLAVPRDQKEAALALGMTRWEAVRNVSLAYGLPGIFSAGILGLARAMGETMAVTMTIGNRVAVTTDLPPAGVHDDGDHRQRVPRGGHPAPRERAGGDRPRPLRPLLPGECGRPAPHHAVAAPRGGAVTTATMPARLRLRILRDHLMVGLCGVALLLRDRPPRLGAVGRAHRRDSATSPGSSSPRCRNRRWSAAAAGRTPSSGAGW
jgi:phosphate transport system permease protein